MKVIDSKFVGYQIASEIASFFFFLKNSSKVGFIVMIRSSLSFPCKFSGAIFLGNILPILLFLLLKGCLTLSSPTKSVMFFLSNGSIRSGKKAFQSPP